MKHEIAYMGIAHVWDSGALDYVNVLNNLELTTSCLEGEKVPVWFAERVAMLRMCDINKSQEGELIGRKFTDHMLYVYLDYDEYKELLKLVQSNRSV